MTATTVAALYVDPRGHYPQMPGVEAWDEARDATRYPGPWPIVAHPPCGPWSRLRHFNRYQDPGAALVAVEQVRRWHGVLEHPEASLLFRHCRLPLPGELPDEFGGWTLVIDQVDAGHVARKRTWLYIVGLTPSEVRPCWPRGTPTHVVNTRKRGSPLKECSRLQRLLTPPLVAAYLVELARAAGRCRPDPVV